MNNETLIYLATPYSHPERNVRVARTLIANMVTAKLMRQGYLVFSPISHSHAMAEECELPGDWEFWERFDRRLLSCCTHLVVIKADGWYESVGVTAERAMAKEMGLPIIFVSTDGELEVPI